METTKLTQITAEQAAEVRIENLSKLFDGVHAVRDVNLHIRQGDFFTFLGPSGCGKTTLLRMVAGFTTPDAGDIYFDDRRVNDVPPWDRNVGMVFQSYALWPHMSVFDNIAFGLKERKTPKAEIQKRVTEALQLVNLEGMEKRRPSQLSGGQQQRVALARTLVVQPRLLLLDEPLSNLDAKLRIQMRNELLRLQRELGITTIYVTHDQEEALAISTRIAVMSQGVVVQQGTPKEIYETPSTQVVADFVGTSNFMAAGVTSVDGDFVELCSDHTETFRVSWSASLEEPPSVGTQMVISIRPESMQVHLARAEQDDSFNRIQGEVLTSVYLGTQIQYEIELKSGECLRVNTANPRGEPLLPMGSAVSLSFAPQEAVLLEADG